MPNNFQFTIDDIIKILEEGLQNNQSCHELQTFAVDQEMLHEIEISGCLDKENCTHPKCDKYKRLQRACLTRWKGRKCGVLTPADRMLVLYSLFKNFS